MYTFSFTNQTSQNNPDLKERDTDAIFDLEQQILDCWGIVDDLDVIFENFYEDKVDKEVIANALLGLKALYQMKFQKTFDTFETAAKEMRVKKSLDNLNQTGTI